MAQRPKLAAEMRASHPVPPRQPGLWEALGSSLMSTVPQMTWQDMGGALAPFLPQMIPPPPPLPSGPNWPQQLADYMAYGMSLPGVGAGPMAGMPIVYHGTPMRQIFGLDPRKAIETRGATFFNDNPDVAEIFRYPREYGEVLTDAPRGRLIKADVNFKNPRHLYGEEAQKFTDDTIYQGKVVDQAKSAGHDGVIAHDVKEGVGDWTERGTTYAAFSPDSYKILSGLSRKRKPKP